MISPHTDPRDIPPGAPLRRGGIDDHGSFELPTLILGSLPHSEPHDCALHRSFDEKRFGLSLLAPKGVGLPYGRFPRLILAHLWVQAARERTPDIILARSLRGLCSLLGVPQTGGPHGYSSLIKKQLSRLACVTVFVNDRKDAARQESLDTVFSSAIVSSFSTSLDSRRSPGSPVSLRLSEELFEYLISQPVPLDLTILQRLRSPLYTLCTWRALPASRRRRPEMVTWHELSQRLGADYTHLRSFRGSFIRHLKTVLHVSPDIRAEVTRDGLIVHPRRR